MQVIIVTGTHSEQVVDREAYNMDRLSHNER
jgi:hypothetical protein